MLKIGRLKTLFSAALVSLALVIPATAHAASYRVVKDDSLYTISKLFNTTIGTVKNNNGLTSSIIYPGQVLNVPAAVYSVKSGDSLYFIAKRYGLSLYSLKKANGEWDDMIYPGQKLALPGVSSASAGNTSANGGSSTGGAKAVVPYSASDEDLLARLITAEAGSEPYSAQVAVGAVVLNRVKSDLFPNTIKGVIYQKNQYYYQFTPVENGWINKPATSDAKKAAYEALHGSDPTKGAIYYFDDSATNKWLWSRPIAARIGKMVYTY